MKPEKLLSICVPTYKRPDLLRRNLISVAAQYQDEVELLVSDDSEDDDALEVVNDIRKKYGLNILFNKNHYTADVPPESKQAYNVNKLIELASGKYIYILHDDDFLVNNELKNIVSEIKTNEDKFKVFLFGVKIVDIRGKVKKIQRTKKSKIYTCRDAVRKLTTDSSFIRTPAIIVSREVYQNVGLYNADAQIPLDFDMWARIFPQYTVYHSKYIVANYTNHTQNQTAQIFSEKYLKIILDIFRNLKNKKVIDDFELMKNQSLFFHQWILAGVYRHLKLGKFQKARSVYELFYLDEVRMLPVAYKWLPVRIVFQLLLLPYDLKKTHYKSQYN